MRLKSAFAMLAALVVLLATGPRAPRASSSSSPAQPTPRPRPKRRRSRTASPAELSTPCRAELKGKKIMLIIGEVQSNGYISAAAAELRTALRGDQHAAARPRAS